MKRVLAKKLSSSRKLFREVLFSPKTSKQRCNEPKQMTQESPLLKEIDALKDQIANLKAVVETLRQDGEKKEIAVAKLAKEKEKLSTNLSKVNRSNHDLTQQLEEERKFYYKEKEVYCHEMNEFKKLKKVLSSSSVIKKVSSEVEVQKLKKTLENTLHTNYNLSIKFLKMKETKTQLRNALRKTEEIQKTTIENLKIKVRDLSRDLEELVEIKCCEPMSPSNKKYLQLAKRNSSLVYENLCLQWEVDKLHENWRKHKLQQTKSESNHKERRPRRERRHNCKENLPCDQEIIKIFERDMKPGVPTVTLLDEKETSKRTRHQLQVLSTNESKLTIFQVSELQSRTSMEIADVKKHKRSCSESRIDRKDKD